MCVSQKEKEKEKERVIISYYLRLKRVCCMQYKLSLPSHKSCYDFCVELWCVFVLKPFSFSFVCMCVCFSKKKKMFRSLGPVSKYDNLEIIVVIFKKKKETNDEDKKRWKVDKSKNYQEDPKILV